MCVAIPIGRRSPGPHGTRLARYLRARPWRLTLAAALIQVPPALALWGVGLLDLFAPMAWLVFGAGIIGLPLAAFLVSRFATLTQTTPPGYLWFGALGLLGVVGGAAWGAGWAQVGLGALALAWWLTGTKLRGQFAWSRVHLAASAALLPLAAWGLALCLGLAALALSAGLDAVLPVLAGLWLAGLVGMAVAAAPVLTSGNAGLTPHRG
jgi:hypothetical protein